jgi:hypothetical protein
MPFVNSPIGTNLKKNAVITLSVWVIWVDRYQNSDVINSSTCGTGKPADRQDPEAKHYMEENEYRQELALFSSNNNIREITGEILCSFSA